MMTEKEQMAVRGMEAIAMKKVIMKWSNRFRMEADQCKLEMEALPDSKDSLVRATELAAEMGLISTIMSSFPEMMEKCNKQVMESLDAII